jgi:hypothetical protein
MDSIRVLLWLKKAALMLTGSQGRGITGHHLEMLGMKALQGAKVLENSRHSGSFALGDFFVFVAGSNSRIRGVSLVSSLLQVEVS